MIDPSIDRGMIDPSIDRGMILSEGQDALVLENEALIPDCAAAPPPGADLKPRKMRVFRHGEPLEWLLTVSCAIVLPRPGIRCHADSNSAA